MAKIETDITYSKSKETGTELKDLTWYVVPSPFEGYVASVGFMLTVSCLGSSKSVK